MAKEKVIDAEVKEVNKEEKKPTGFVVANIPTKEEPTLVDADTNEVYDDLAWKAYVANSLKKLQKLLD